MLNERGKLIGDFTVAKTGDDELPDLGLVGGAEIPHALVRGASAEGRLGRASTASTRRWSACPSPGRRAQALLQKLVDVDVSSKAFRFMDFREMAVGGAPCMVNRITYTGDLGYEIWMAPAYQRLVYAAIKEAGEEFGIVDFGMRALLSMRLEKNFPTWFRELRPIYGAVRRRHGPLHQAGEERLHRPRGRRARSRRKAAEAAPRLARRRCASTPT